MITILLLLCLTALCFSAAAETTEEEALLTEGFRPVVEQLSAYYDISKLELIDSHWETNALGTALYGTFRLELTLKANSLDELPHFQGVLHYTGLDSAVDVTLADIVAARSNDPAAFFSIGTACADIRDEAALRTFAEMVQIYGDYIGTPQVSYYTISVTAQTDGSLDAAYADLTGIRHALGIYFPESEEKMQQNGMADFCSRYIQHLDELSGTAPNTAPFFSVTAKLVCSLRACLLYFYQQAGL